MVEVDLIKHLLNDATLQTLISNSVYPLLAPENSPSPYITVQTININDETSLEGVNYSSKYTFQIDVFSSFYEQMKEITSAVKSSVYQFSHIVYEFNSRDIYEKDTQLHRQLIEFKINKRGD
ncbi:tail completion protein gp17 [Arcobacter arenosus]|uniref:DUF3168 domain-containing protein n=1 Tax=Arcobacter arenosus TaxID=2576037 RepID=A0A5R8Y4J2_9BACT|nr:DUF3168 domain-containing protein [Arcobacter arenosus]TLP41039.1 DUF3168 domain-containing protein [Arcobacter arenosus]